MNNRPQHTFTWLKVLSPVLILETITLYLMSVPADGKSHGLSSFLLSLVLLVSLLGLLLGLLLNYLTKFKRAILFYILGHIVSIAILIAISYFMFQVAGSGNDKGKGANETVSPTDLNDTTSTVLSGTEKHAIEEVLYLMEQQYPLGEYELVDIVTKAANNGTICTVVFTLPEEGPKKYISQYIVGAGAPEAVYTRQDTTSAAYVAYKREKEASRY